MRHSYFGRKLSRSTNERKRLLVLLCRNFIAHGSLRTTVAKAKTVAPIVEKLITRAKQGGDNAFRLLMKELSDTASVRRLMEDAKDRFLTRTSGYTRIIRIGKRKGDSAEEVLLTFVDAPVVHGEIVHEVKPTIIKKEGEKVKIPKTPKKKQSKAKVYTERSQVPAGT